MRCFITKFFRRTNTVAIIVIKRVFKCQNVT